MIRLFLVGALSSGLLFAQGGGQRIPRQTSPATGAVEGLFQNELRLGLGDVAVTIRNLATNRAVLVRTSGDGIFRVPALDPGRYSVRAELDGYRTFERSDLTIRAGDLVNLEVTLAALAVTPRRRIPEPKPELPGPKLPPPSMPDLPVETSVVLPPDDVVFREVPDRWKFEWPQYHRYGPQDEAPYIHSHWYDPYNRNKLKGDYPIFGRDTFLNITLTSDTFSTGRRLPLPSGTGSADPDSPDFFGRLGQFAFAQTLGFSFDLFHGDTAFKPIDWRIKVTPEINVNYVRVKENGILNPDVRTGTTRVDAQLGLQEAFFEAKLKDLSHSYDFVSTRIGIQTFNSDFRGLVFFDQEPGARVFGNFGANRYQYNAAYFAMLEKDTNSGLNSMAYRNQQVMVANLYRQDFFAKGYTLQASYHLNKDDPSVQFDTNHFLVRPAPIGAVKNGPGVARPAIRAHYFGLAGDGHIGRLNLSHAFYQVLGHDNFNLIAGRRQSLNAQMAAGELSMDRDWIRFRTAFFFASGDKSPRDETARGFDAIFDQPNFAGGFFSFWNREGIRLTSTGVGLVQGSSLLPSLRSSKIQGQANFVNPGILIYNAGGDVELTPKLRAVINFNAMRFHHPEPLELLLFQKPVRSGIGLDSGFGVVYRPPLSENIVITGVFNSLVPFQGFRDIYTGTTLYSIAANVRFRY